MHSYTVAEAEAELNRLIELVEAGEEVTITKRGKPVARLVPSTAPRQRLLSLAELRAHLPQQQGSAGTFIRELRDTDRY